MIAISEGMSDQPELATWLPLLGDASQIEMVMAYDSSVGRFTELMPGESPNPSVPIRPGDGLIVYATEARTVTFESVVCSTRDLVPGLNLVGFACTGDDYSAFQLLQDLGIERAASIQRYLRSEGRFETAFLGANDLHVQDIEHIVMEGSVMRLEVDRESRERKYAIFGKSCDGFEAEVVAKIKGLVVMITVYLL